MKAAGAVVAFVSCSLAAAASAQTRPVMIGGDPNLDACSSFYRVEGLNPRGDGFLSVRSAPGVSSPETDRLVNNTYVTVCDRAGDWYGIVYRNRANDPNASDGCGVSSPVPRKRAYAGPCRSGWVHRRWVRVIAG